VCANAGTFIPKGKSAVELQPEELLLAALVRRAIKDAQGKQERVREEAAQWLWDHAPAIAERAGVQIKVVRQ
jgi:hypothetical protein